MGILPELKYSARLAQTTQLAFGGLRHHTNCGDGEIYDMANLTARDYPVLGSRPTRWAASDYRLQGAVSIFRKSGNTLWVGDDGYLRLSLPTGAVFEIAPVSDPTRAELVRMGQRVVLWPNKILLNLNYTITGVAASLEDLPQTAEDNTAWIVEAGQAAGGSLLYVHQSGQWIQNGRFDEQMEVSLSLENVTVGSGSLYDDPAEANTLTLPIMDSALRELLRAGDAVHISGMSREANNKVAVIRQIEAGEEDNTTLLHFTEHSFSLPEGQESYTEIGPVLLEKKLPELDFVFEHANRLWGAKGKVIAASALGDPSNWYIFDGLATDSWELVTQEPGDITAGISYQGYATFFRTDGRTVIYGDVPAAFGSSWAMLPGVRPGARRSLGIAGGLLYYLGKEGMYSYDGSAWPQSLSQVFGEEALDGGLAAWDGSRYYVQLLVDGQWGLYVMDAAKGLWMRETTQGCQRLADLCYDGEDIYGLDSDNGRLWRLTGQGDAETDLYSYMETGDYTDGSPMKKSLNRLLLRLELGEGALLQVQIKYDSEDNWQTLRQIAGGKKKRTWQLYLTPRRADHYRLRIEAWGQWRLYSMARQIYTGTER